MKITVKRSGGFAGITSAVSADTASLPSEQAAKINAIVSQVTSAQDSGTMMPDAFQYDVDIEDETGSKSLHFSGDPCPAAVLFNTIKAL